MDIQTELSDSDLSMNMALQAFYEENQITLLKQPYITTTTTCFYLSNAPRNVSNIVCEVEEPSNSLTRSLVDEVFGGQIMFFPKKGNNSFHNCKIFVLKDRDTCIDKVNNIAIKCFTNGTLHITGATKLHRAYEIAQMFCVLMEVVDGGSGLDDAYTISHYSIQLINVHIGLRLPQGTSINLHKLYQQIQAVNQYSTQYDNNRHSGVIVKFLTTTMVYVTILFFDTGNIILCGAKTVDDLRDTLKFAINLIEGNRDNLLIDTKCITKNTLMRQEKGNRHFDYGEYIILK